MRLNHESKTMTKITNPASPGSATPVQPTQPAREQATPAVGQTRVMPLNNGWPAPEQAKVHRYTPAELDRIAGIKR